MKSKIMAGVLMFIIISLLLTGCGGKQKEIPYPDGYYVPKPEETETAGKSDKSQKNASETAKNDLKSARALFAIEDYRGANNRAY